MAVDFGSKPTRNIRKRRAAELSDDDDDDELLLSQPLSARSDVKKKPFPLPDDSNLRVCSSSFCFDSSGSVQVDHDSRATAAASETVKREPEFKSARSGGGGEKESLYRGMGGYTDYRAGFRREKGGYGPLRAPAHIRASARFDYQPDVCKDYKATGFCGYGDACKFLHDRGDYKSGWQLDKEWDDAKKATTMPGRRQDDDDADADADADADELPFACSICRLPFRDPVVTKCKHYFCGNCALKLYSKNKKCFVCNKATLGIFNTAHEIRKKMAALDRGT